MRIDRANSALLIVAHGSTVNPDSSAPTLAHATEIRRVFGTIFLRIPVISSTDSEPFVARAYSPQSER
jgi:hypothetical protein